MQDIELETVFRGKPALIQANVLSGLSGNFEFPAEHAEVTDLTLYDDEGEDITEELTEEEMQAMSDRVLDDLEANGGLD